MEQKLYKSRIVEGQLNAVLSVFSLYFVLPPDKKGLK